MKRKLLIIIIVFSITALHAQTQKASKPVVATLSTIQSNSYVALVKFKGDASGYVQHNFIDNKQKYVGKDLKTQPTDID